MPIKYTGPSDSGVNQADSISPVQDGESATSAVLTRPTEVLRDRTETLRTFVDIEEMARKAMGELEVVSATGMSVTWDGAWDGVPGAPALGVANSGGLSSAADIVIRPLGNPLTANFAAHTFVNGGYNYTITSLVRAYQGGNRLQWKAVNTGRTIGAAVEVTVYGGTEILDANGAGQYGSYIVADYLATATLSDMTSAIALNPAAAAMVAATYAPGDATQLMFAVAAPTSLSGGKDAFQLTISAATLTAFFNAAEANRLQTGDILAVNFSSVLSTLTRNADSVPSAVVATGDLFNSRVSPGSLEFAVPVFSVATDGINGVLTGGTLCEPSFASVPGRGDWESHLASNASGQGASLVGIEDLAGNFVATTAESAITENWTTHNQQVTDLASSVNGVGASLVGVEDAGNLYAGSTVEAALQEVGTEAYSSSAALVRQFTHYDGVISGLVPSFNWTGTGLITYTSGQVVVRGKVFTVPSFTVGAFGSGATLASNATVTTGAVVYIGASGLPTLLQSVGINRLTVHGAVLARVQFSATNLLAVWDAQRHVVADTDPSKLVVSANTTVGEGDVTAYPQFASFASAVYWAEHQAVTASARHTILVKGTVPVENSTMDSVTAGAALAATPWAGTVDVNVSLDIMGEGTYSSILSFPVATHTVSPFRVVSSSIKDIRFLASATTIASNSGVVGLVEANGSVNFNNVAIDLTGVANTAHHLLLSGAGSQLAIIKGLLISEALDTDSVEPVYIISHDNTLTGVRGVAQTTRSSTLLAVAGNRNNIEIFSRKYLSPLYWVSSSDNRAVVDSDTKVSGGQTDTVIGIRTEYSATPMSIFVSPLDFKLAPNAQAGVDLEYTTLFSPQAPTLANLASTSQVVYAFVKTPFKFTVSGADVLVSNADPAVKLLGVDIDIIHSPVGGILSRMLITTGASVSIPAASSQAVYSVPLALSSYGINDGVVGVVTPTRDYLAIKVTIPLVTTGADLKIYGVRINGTLNDTTVRL